MINIEYINRGKTHDLRITGHAGFSDCGNDIVCAGVSAITYTLLGYLADSDDVQTLAYTTDSGDCTVTCVGGDRVQTAFDMAVTGYQMIAFTYPDHVTIHIAEFDG